MRGQRIACRRRTSDTCGFAYRRSTPRESADAHLYALARAMTPPTAGNHRHIRDNLAQPARHPTHPATRLPQELRIVSPSFRHTHASLHVSWFVVFYSSCPVARICGFPKAMEDSPSGLWRTLGKRVGVTASRVRISYPPPGFEPRKPLKTFGFRGFALIPPPRLLVPSRYPPFRGYRPIVGL